MVNHGWFHHSWDFPWPEIATRGANLKKLWTIDLELDDIRILWKMLRIAQEAVSNNVEQAKAAWPAHQAVIIHMMKFDPNFAWKSVKLLAASHKIHHDKPTFMSLRLLTGY